MKAYGVPRHKALMSPDKGDGREFAIRGVRYHNPEAKAQTRRTLKKRERNILRREELDMGEPVSHYPAMEEEYN